MVLLIVAVVAVGTALIVLSIVDVLPGIVLLIGGLVAALALGDRLDRGRRGPRSQAASFDADRGVIATPSTFALPPLVGGSRDVDMTTGAAGLAAPDDDRRRD